jgi:hypothetical protein
MSVVTRASSLDHQQCQETPAFSQLILTLSFPALLFSRSHSHAGIRIYCLRVLLALWCFDARLHQQLVLVCDTTVGRLLDQHTLRLRIVYSSAADNADA